MLIGGLQFCYWSSHVVDVPVGGGHMAVVGSLCQGPGWGGHLRTGAILLGLPGPVTQFPWMVLARTLPAPCRLPKTQPCWGRSPWSSKSPSAIRLRRCKVVRRRIRSWSLADIAVAGAAQEVAANLVIRLPAEDSRSTNEAAAFAGGNLTMEMDVGEVRELGWRKGCDKRKGVPMAE